MSSRRALLPLTPLYAAALAAKNALYATGILRPKKLAQPVISVGNLSTGGSGKTPFILALSELLAAAGWQADVLTRGYGRLNSEIARVDPEGTATQFGDEPLLLARAGLPVYVGASRYRAGLLAEAQPAAGKQVHLLDDGMQHRKLARQVEIVLLLKADFDDALLPSGNLREPLSALHRADIIVLRAEDSALESRVRTLLGPRRNPIFWRVQRSLKLRTLAGEPAAIPQRALAFCALARPAAFLSSLRDAGCIPFSLAAARDHHIYTPRDMQSLAARAISQNADALITTAKDACKLSPVLLATLTNDVPVLVADLITTIHDQPTATAQLLALLTGNTPSA
jgi:tetraacyldisaccharide 4'-kinase